MIVRMSSNAFLKAFLTIAILTNASMLWAHELSTTFVSAEIRSAGDRRGELHGQLKLDILDLKEVVNLDINSDGALTWGEIQKNRESIETYVYDGMRFSIGLEQCQLSLSQAFELQIISSVSYLIIPFSSPCEGAGLLNIEYSMLFDAASNHKAIINLVVDSEEHVFIADAQNKRYSIDIEVNASSKMATLGAFIYQGIFHILIGIDHILFLFTLLLTICLYREKGEWHGIQSTKTIVKKTFWLITSFTIAHSITLSGTALGILPTMGSWIEVVIAASILFNVVNNIFPFLRKLSVITFVFGLIHGMGFAGALSELGFSEKHQLLTVLGFNLGVEIGQLALLLVFLPVLLKLRNSKYYQWYGVQFLSMGIGVVAIYWILERW